ncbi:hypothetical protein MPLB_100041 [Mesorhizobium sp. ORS 3324]|nr:hypothetical protein MPLB_100041 [Mesorhizobium sp. ORS 3324]
MVNEVHCPICSLSNSILVHQAILREFPGVVTGCHPFCAQWLTVKTEWQTGGSLGESNTFDDPGGTRAPIGQLLQKRVRA